MFKHLIIKNKEEGKYDLNYEKYKEIAKVLKIDFLSVSRNGEISFLHVASIHSFDFIDKNGLKPLIDDFVLDLGQGLYVISKEINYDVAIENLLNYVAEEIEDEKLLVIKGKYNGKFTECVFGEGHEGYIVLKSSVPREDIEIIEMSVDDFLWNFGIC